MRRPKNKSIIGTLVVVVVALYVISTYVAFMGYRDNLARNGEWYIEFQANFDRGMGALQIVNPSIDVVYEKHPGYVSYIDWFFGQFQPSEFPEQQENATIYTIHVKIDTVIKEKTRQVLFDKRYVVSLDDLVGGVPLILNKTFGPYIAYNSSLPLKVSYVIEIIDYSGVIQTSTGANYVSQWKE